MDTNDYKFETASEVNTRGGIGDELWKNDELIVEIFRDDANKSKVITLFQKSIPLKIMEESIDFFKRNISENHIDQTQ